MNLSLPDRGLTIDEICRNLEKIFIDRARDGAVPVLRPSLGFPVIVDRDNEVYQICGHAADILRAWIWQSLHMPKLGVRVEVPDNLKPVEPRQDGLNLPMAPVMGDHALGPSGSSLKAEGMLDDKAVFELIAEKKAEAFALIYLGRAEQQVQKCVFR